MAEGQKGERNIDRKRDKQIDRKLKDERERNRKIERRLKNERDRETDKEEIDK